MSDKAVDLKKIFKSEYFASSKPSIIDVAPGNFIMVDGFGDPNGNDLFQDGIEILYTISYAIKMSKKGDFQPEGYFDFVVAPLEGLWWTDGGEFSLKARDNWVWTIMIRQPEFVDADAFEWALCQAKLKKPELDFSRARLEEFDEGKCAQILHTGPYADEPATLGILGEFVDKSGYHVHMDSTRRHHEIYLSDPRKAVPEKMKTILRLPLK